MHSQDTEGHSGDTGHIPIPYQMIQGAVDAAPEEARFVVVRSDGDFAVVTGSSPRDAYEEMRFESDAVDAQHAIQVVDLTADERGQGANADAD